MARSGNRLWAASLIGEVVRSNDEAIAAIIQKLICVPIRHQRRGLSTGKPRAAAVWNSGWIGGHGRASCVCRTSSQFYRRTKRAVARQSENDSTRRLQRHPAKHGGVAHLHRTHYCKQRKRSSGDFCLLDAHFIRGNRLWVEGDAICRIENNGHDQPDFGVSQSGVAIACPAAGGQTHSV